MLKSLELKQERLAVSDQAKAISDRAEKETRDITMDENKEYRRLCDLIDKLSHEIVEAEKEEQRQAEEAAAAFVASGRASGGNVILAGQGQQSGLRYLSGGNGGHSNSDIETAEVVLPANRSVHSYLSSRGMIHQTEFDRLSFGAFLRAMITGPKNELERRALAEGTDSAGGFSVPDIVLSRFIDKLRAAMVTITAGAQTVPLTSDKTTIARIATDPVAGWRSENAAVDVVDNTYEGVVFVPRSLACIVKASRELVEDSVNIEQMLEAAFLGALSVELDRVALIGSGTPPEPKGISLTTNVGSVSMGTNGAALTDYDKIIDTVYECWVDNSPVISAAVMHPRTLTAIGKLKEATTNAYRTRPVILDGIPFLQTTSLSIAETQGSASNASRIILGDFTQLMLGIRTSLRIEVLRELYAGNLQYGYLAHLRADIGLAHPEAFAQLIGIIP